jgi:acylphosphatase
MADVYYVFHAYVSGMVQGVGFRFFTLHKARKYIITGWVKNLYDGRVEIEAEGKKENLILFLEDIKIGPSYGHVSGVTEEWHEIGFPRYKNFAIAY